MSIQFAVRDLLKFYGIRPSKSKGQNFLVDEEVYDSIVRAARLQAGDTVLEIGPGLGTLTERLTAQVKHVVAVELDHLLVRVLHDRLVLIKNVTIVEGDILAKPVSAFNVTAPYRVVANIPYNITGAILKKFLTHDVQPTSMTLLMQKEVGERVTAKPGAMSLLALSVQLYGEPSIARIVPRTSFLPAPQVDSVILNIARIHPFPWTDVPEKFFWRVARIGFSAKRKQLHNNIAGGFQLSMSEAKKILESVGVQPIARAEALTLEQWHSLARELQTSLS